MKIKAGILILIGTILLFYAYKLENEAYANCIETLTPKECTGIFG
jgi:hypothetical protein